MKISFFFAWYDAWIGAFWDSKKRVLYVCPIPCCVVKLEFGPKKLHKMPKWWDWRSGGAPICDATECVILDLHLEEECVSPSEICYKQRATKGWWCSRKMGHDGPCAARKMHT